MSGVEMAGLILGVFPLIVTALEAYEEGFEPLKDWWKFRSEFTSFIHVMGRQAAIFDENLEELLAPIVSSDAEMDALLSDPGGPAWRDPKLEQRLRERLPKSYEWYIVTIVDINKVMEKLMGKLGIEGGKTDWLKSESDKGKIKWDYEFKRIKFSLSKKKRDALVSKLEKLNQQLREILGTSERLERSRQRRSGKGKNSFAASIEKIREHATSLHSALSQRWRCNCLTSHNANLRLERRTEDHAKSPWDSNGNSETSLKLLFYFETNPFLPPSEWNEAEVKVIEPEDIRPPQMVRASSSPAKPTAYENSNIVSDIRDKFRRKSTSATPQSPASLLRSGALSPTIPTTLSPTSIGSPCLSPKSPGHKPRKSVTFNEETSTPNAIYGNASLNSSLATLVDLQAAEIEDLCSILRLQRTGRGGQSFGYIEDEKRRVLSFVPLASHDSLPEQHDIVSLHSLLTSQNPPLTRRERLSIAVTLSSSLIQLHSTPWTGEGWSKRDIIFLRSKGGPKRTVVVDQPYVTRHFLSISNPRSPGLSRQNPFNNLNNDCTKVIFSLGILLLELCFGQALENQPIRQKYLGPDGEPNDFTDFATAREWLELVQEEGGPDFWNAIRRCLFCAFGPRSTSLADDEFRQAVYDEVVKPLEDMLKRFE